METREQKVGRIKSWLQRFGDRDNETFSTEVLIEPTTGRMLWRIMLQYDYNENGERVEPYDWCIRGFKDTRGDIADRTDEELDLIIEALYKKKLNW